MNIATPDGTVISVLTTGAGPPLMMVTGTGDDQARYDRAAGPLAERFTLYRVDRRGRGASTDAIRYTLAAEVDDMLAAIHAIHAEAGPVDVLAHSHGAVVCLEAAPRTDKVRALMMYEPPMPCNDTDPETVAWRHTMVEMLDQLLREGEVDEMLRRYLRDLLRVPAEAVDRQMSDRRAWERWMSLAPTIPRELIAIRDYRFDCEKFRDLAIPVRILLGTASNHPVMRKTAEIIRAAIPQTEIVELPGQGHTAMTSSPELFAAEVIDFFRSARETR